LQTKANLFFDTQDTVTQCIAVDTTLHERCLLYSMAYASHNEHYLVNAIEKQPT